MASRQKQTGQFAPPCLMGKYIGRDSLLEVFERSAETGMVCVAAPGGYGKSVSTVLWLKESKRGAVWLTVGDFDDVPSQFYRRFCEALQDAFPDAEVLKDYLNNPMFDSSPIEYTIDAVKDIVGTDNDESKMVLVLDDFDKITRPETIKSMPTILGILAQRFVIVILGRKRTIVDCAPASMKKDLELIGVDQLKFSLEEVKDCFAIYGQKLGYQEARSVKGTTGGWPIAVGGIASSDTLPERKPKEEVLQECIERLLWDQWDASTKKFLTVTSLLKDEIDPEICDKLSDRNDSAKLLAALSSEHSLITRTGGGLYQYHDYLLSFLRKKLAKLKKKELTELYCLASDYYFEKKRYYKSLYHAIKGGGCSKNMYESLKALISRDNRIMSVAEQVHRMWYYDEDNLTLTEKIIQENPYVYIMTAWHRYLAGDEVEMARNLDRLYDSLPDIKKDFPDFWESAVLVCLLDHRKNITQILKMLKPFESNKGKLATTSLADNVASITQNMPYLHRSVRDFSDLSVGGNFEKVFAKSFPAILGRDYPMVASGIKAALCYEKNQLSDALEYATESVGSLFEASTGHPELCFAANMMNIQILDALGQDAEVQNQKRLLAEYIERTDSLYLYPNYNAYIAKCKMEEGDVRAAPAWLSNYFIDEEYRAELYKISQHLTTARALMLAESLDNAKEFIQRLIDLTTTFNRTIDRAEALTLMSILEWHRGQKKVAIEPIEEALAMMQPYRFIRVFAGEGAAVLPMIRKLITITSRKDYVGNLDPVYLKEIYIAAYDISKRRCGLVGAMKTKPIKLSRQQREMIRYLALGYRNSDIAESTGLTLNTVKVHTALAYKKLGVNNSAEAVLKARALGLLDDGSAAEAGIVGTLRLHRNPQLEQTAQDRYDRAELDEAEKRGYEAGIEAGRREMALKIAKIMSDGGMPTDLVIMYTGLRIEDLPKIN